MISPGMTSPASFIHLRGGFRADTAQAGSARRGLKSTPWGGQVVPELSATPRLVSIVKYVWRLKGRDFEAQVPEG